MALTKAQKEFRQRGISASDVAAICGLNPWRSPVGIWESKVLPIEDDDEETTEAMERGNELEDALLSWMGRRVEKVIGHNTGPEASTFQSKKHELVLATPDGLVYADPFKRSIDASEAVAEVKSPGPNTIHDWTNPIEMPDGVPEYYLPQVTWQMAATGLDAAYVGALVGGSLWTYQIDFNRELFDALLSRAESFWTDHVIKQEPPPVDGSKDYGEYLRRRFPSHQGALMTSNPEIDARVVQLLGLQKQITQIKNEAEAVKQELMMSIGDHEGVKGEWGRVSWKTPKPTARVDKKTLEAYCSENDLDISQFMIENKATRRFNVYPSKAFK